MSRDQWRAVKEQLDLARGWFWGNPRPWREDDPKGQFSTPLDATTIAPGEPTQGRTVKARTREIKE